MRIERLELGFGSLRGEVRLSNDRCNLILAPNESGKSTLVSAILAALYGLPEERRSKHRPIPSRDAFRPWDGGPYRVQLSFRVGGEGYTLERDFDRDRVTLVEARTGMDIADRFRDAGGRYRVLERLVALESEDFVRSALVRQQEIQTICDSSDITHRLQRFATSRRGDVTAGEALDFLDGALIHYPGTLLAGAGRVETEITRLDERLGEIRDREEALEEDRRRSEADLRVLEELMEEERRLEEQLHRLDALRTAAIVREIDRDLEERGRAAARLETLRAEARDLAEHRDFPLQLVDGMNELHGKLDELTARVEAEVQATRGDVLEPLAAVRQERETLAPLRNLRTDDEELLETLSVRLRDLQAAESDGGSRQEEERRRLESEGIDLAEALSLRDRFGSLSQEERSFLHGYRERLLELQVQRRELENTKAPSAATPGAARTLAGILLLGLGPALWASMVWNPWRAIPIGVGVLAVIGGSLLLRRFAPHGAGAHPGAAPTDAEIVTLHTRAGELCRRFEFLDPGSLVAAFRRWTENERLVDRWAGIEDGRARGREESRRLELEASELLRRAGRSPAPGPPDPRSIARVRADLDRDRRLREREAELERRARDSERNREALEARRREVADRMHAILTRSGLNVTGPDDPGPEEEDLRRFAAAARNAERYRQLSNQLIPEAERATAPGEHISARRGEKEAMARLLTEILEERPQDPPPQPHHPSSHYMLEHKRTLELFQAAQDRKRDLVARTGELFRRYREEMPRLRKEDALHRAARDRAQRFGEAVRLAKTVLTDIARDSYREWASALNERTNGVLVHLNPAYRDIRFNTDLSFTLEEVATGRRLRRSEVDAHLSSGARDQIYLAIRLAVSDFFSTGPARLPLILDDVLATSDDERFDRAMTFFAEQALTRHQLIVLSCQKDRHHRWRRSHPDLFQAHFKALDLPVPAEASGRSKGSRPAAPRVDAPATTRGDSAAR